MSDELKIKVVPFHVEHVKLMDVRQHELQGIFKSKDIDIRLEALQQLSTAGTIIYDGRILGVMGYVEMWRGTCEVYVLPSEYIKEYGLVFARIIKSNLKMLREVQKFHRIQVTAVDDDKHKRWLEWLGFKCEGVLKKYSINQQDYKMWAII